MNCKTLCRGFQVGGLKEGHQFLPAAGLAVKRGGKMGELLISPGGGDTKTRMDEEDRRAFHGREKIERVDSFAASGGERQTCSCKKKGHIRTKLRRDRLKLFRRERVTEDFVQGKERRGGVADAAAAETGRERDVFFQAQAHAVGDARRFEEKLRGAIDEVSGIGGKFGVAAGQLNPMPRALEGQAVENADGIHDRLQLVKAIRALAEDIQQGG